MLQTQNLSIPLPSMSTPIGVNIPRNLWGDWRQNFQATVRQKHALEVENVLHKPRAPVLVLQAVQPIRLAQEHEVLNILGHVEFALAVSADGLLESHHSSFNIDA